MQIRLLGHLEASVDDRPVALGGAKQRAVLAMLGLEANRSVTADRLIEGLWGEDAAAERGQDGAELRLAAAQGARRRRRRGDPHARARVRAADRPRAGGRAAARAARRRGGARRRTATRRARRWRCSAATRWPTSPTSRSRSREIRRLEELRLTAAELAIDADLAAGPPPRGRRRDRRAAGREPAARASPRRSGCWRCTAAGARPRRSRRTGTRATTLVEADRRSSPDPSCSALHAAILRQDPALNVEPRRERAARRSWSGGGAPLIGRERELRALRDAVACAAAAAS